MAEETQRRITARSWRVDPKGAAIGGSCDFPFFRLSGRLITNGHVRAESVATTVQCSTTYSSTLPMRPVRVDEKDG